MRLLRSEQGFTYVAAMIIVVIMGVMLAAAGQSWTTIMKREREEELIFRGTQIVRAIELWRTPEDKNKNRMLNELKDLQKDPQAAGTKRYLRKIFTDPMTGKDFELIKDPAVGIKGVKSTSQDEPMKQSEFPVEWWEFEGKKKYSEWEFVFIKGNKDRPLSKRPNRGGVSGLPTDPNPTK